MSSVGRPSTRNTPSSGSIWGIPSGHSKSYQSMGIFKECSPIVFEKQKQLKIPKEFSTAFASQKRWVNILPFPSKNIQGMFRDFLNGRTLLTHLIF